jgi:hypothetical protein
MDESGSGSDKNSGFALDAAHAAIRLEKKVGKVVTKNTADMKAAAAGESFSTAEAWRGGLHR